jgi:phosphoribosylglycinamide formyltransferase-1
MQARVPVLPSDNVESLAQRVLSQEHIIYPRVVKWFVDGRLRLQNNQVYLDNRPLYQPAVHLGY